MEDPASDAAIFENTELHLLRRRLLAWFRRHARDLPWRRTRDPYRVWVSEIMLQQTQVATVVPYFERFIARWPDAAALAAADEQDVLRAWEGLGYYRRARQLYAAAQVVSEQHGGKFPTDFDDVYALPGIGRYTAGAILSIALDQRWPILEANTQRLLSRLAAYQQDISKSAGQKLLWSLAEALLPRRSVGAFNQALMEVGSQICTPREPDCVRCPLAAFCRAHRHGLVEQIPVSPKKMNYEELREAAVVIYRDGKVLVRQCQPGQRWAGLWDFPRFAVSAESGGRLKSQLTRHVAELTGLEIKPGRRLTTIKHGVTRFRITLSCHEAECVGGRLHKAAAPARWLPPHKLEQLPLSVTGRKISRLICAADSAVE